MSAATKYEGIAKDLLYQLKFGRASAAAKDAARVLNERLDFPKNVLFVPVPTAPRRVRVRGYDQAALIAQNLASLRGEASVSLLARLGQQRQVGQSRQIRVHQMNKAFRTIARPISPDTPIVLVDDVLTTGASIEAAANQLRSAGFRHISAVVFAVA